MLNWNLNDNSGNGNGGAKKNFTKFPEGITKIRVLLGEGERPFMRWTHWLPQFERKITCPGFGCPIDELIKTAKANKQTPPYQSNRAFSINIWNYDTGRLEILEEGITMIEILQDALMEALEDNPVAHITDFVLKVRKKKSASTGKNTWTITLDDVVPMNDEEKKAFDERTEFDEYFKAPTIEQVRDLLMVSATSKPEYQEHYNRIMGYAKQADEADEGLGVVIE